MPGRLPRRQKQNRKLSHRSITASLSWLTVVTFAAKAIPPCSSVDPVVPAFRVLSDLCGESRFPVFLRGPRGSSFRVLSDLCGKSRSPCSSVDPVVPAFRALSDLCGESRSPVFLRGPRGSSFRVLSDHCGKSRSPCSSVPPVVPAFPSVLGNLCDKQALRSDDQKLATSDQFHA